MLHRISAIACALLLITTALPAAQTFGWSMESDIPELTPPGSDATPHVFPPAPTLLSSAQALSGKSSLDLSGAMWKQVTFNNASDNPLWAPTQEGAVVLHWKYTGTLKTCILMQLTGRMKGDPKLDRDDGLLLRIRDGKELLFLYNWDNAKQGTKIRFVPPEGFVADRWYRVTAKWNTASKPYLWLQVDDLPAVTGDVQPGATSCGAWHHLLWGNDTRTLPDGLYLDDVAVWNDFAMQPTTAQ